MEQLPSMWWKEDGEVAVSFHPQQHQSLTHYIITAVAMRFSAVPRGGAEEKCLWHVPVFLNKTSWHPLTRPEPHVLLPAGENLAISCQEAQDRQSITWHFWGCSHLSWQLTQHGCRLNHMNVSKLFPNRSNNCQVTSVVTHATVSITHLCILYYLINFLDSLFLKKRAFSKTEVQYSKH